MYDYLDTLGLELSVFEHIQNEEHFFVCVTGNASENYRIFLIQGIYIYSYRKPDGYLILEINEDFLEQKLAMFGAEEGKDCYLIEAGTGYIGKDAESQSLVSSILETQQETGTVRMEGIRYIYSIGDSEYLNMRYCYVTKSNLFYRDVYLILWFTLILLVVLLLVGYVFAKTFTRRNTEPLYQMMEVMHTGENRKEDLSYETLVSEVTGLTGKVRNYEECRSREYLYQIFNGQEREEKQLLEYERQQAAELEGGFYVMSIKLMNVTELSDFNILVFCISNIFGELLSEQTALFPVENWDRVYFLIKEKSEKVEEKIVQGIRYLEERLSITVTVGLSRRLLHFTELLEGKQQTDYMTEYQELNQQFSHPVWYEDVMAVTASGKKNYNEDLKKMMHLVMAEDYSKAGELLEQIRKNLSDISHQNVNRSRMQMMTVMSIISIPYREKYGRTDVLQKTDWNTLPEIYEASAWMLNELARVEETKGGQSTFEQMREYIRQHAAEPTITAGAVSEAFSFTASYASGMFKKYAGEGILDTIHRDRIDQAKQLLRKGLAVQEVATAVGYLDARSFIRAFKKYEGITPGQYKNI